MPSHCAFSFNRLNPVYYSGETINGRITLTTTSRKTVRGVYIIFEGAAKVRWEEKRSRPVDGKIEHYTEYFRGDETYLNTQTCVFGDGELPPGRHDYSFSIPLPLHCPTSVIEKYGKISYEISLKLDRPFRFADVFNQPLTVIKKLDLNYSPEYLIPIRGEDVKYFCCWPCSSGPVTSTLTIPFGGWAPGQEISYKLEIDNHSNYDLDGTELKLKQIYNFTAHSPSQKSRTHENILSKLDQHNRTVIRFTKRTFEGKLRVPPVPPSCVYGGGILQVHYRIEMNIKTGNGHIDSEIGIPITIGTIPLIQSATNPNNVIAIPATAPTPDTPDYFDGLPKYDVFMPPTFEEATHIGERFQDNDKRDFHQISTADFVPKYPMYNNFAVKVNTAAIAPPTDINDQRDIVESHLLLNVDFNASGLAVNAPPSNSLCPYPTLDVGGNEIYRPHTRNNFSEWEKF